MHLKRVTAVLLLIMFLQMNISMAQSSGSPSTDQAPTTMNPPTTQSSDYDNQKRVTDLMYMTNKGDRSAIWGYSYSGLTGSINLPDATLFSNIDSKATQFNLKTYYGMTENFYISLGVGYLVGNSIDYVYGPAAGTANGQKITLKYQGFQDIFLEFKLSPLKQETVGINVNIGFIYSPKFSDRAAPTASTTGDAVRGGEQTDLLFQIGNKFKNFAYSFEVDYGILGKRSSRDTTGLTTQTTGGNPTTMTLNFQFQPLERLILNVGVARGSITSLEQTPSSGSVAKESDYFGYGVLGSAIFELVPDKCYVSFDLNRLTLGAHDIVFGTTTYKVSDQVNTQYGIRLITNL